MKRILIFAALAAMVLFAAAPSSAYIFHKEAMTFATADSLKAATSADTLISGWFNIDAWQYVGAEVYLDRVYGGAAGAGAIYFQGRVGTHTPENIFFVNHTDSLAIVNTLAVSGAADLQYYFSFLAPVEIKNQAANRDNVNRGMVLLPVSQLPYDQIRMYVLDTNWTFSGHAHGSWILKK